MPDVLFKLLVLKTRQLDVLREFYSALGIELTREKHGEGPLHFAGRIGDSILELYPLSTEPSPPDATTRLGFAVGDLAKTLAALEGLGVTIDAKSQRTAWGTRAVVGDPDGRAVELYQQ